MQNNLVGLSSEEVAKKQKQNGYNEIADHEKRSVFKIIFGILTEPMIFLLLAAVAIYFMLGDKKEALVLMASVIVVVTIELYQDNRTEKALEALRSMSSPACQVIRGGKHETIPSRELVVGDLVLVAEGARVPADGKLVEATNIMADESLLTGESVPVNKTTEDDESKVFSGSMIVKGHGIFEVTAIGEQTEIGKIGSSLNQIKEEKTRLQIEINRFVKVIAIIAVTMSLLLTLLFWIMRGELLKGFLAGITLAISILPEEFPVVLTVFMALGAWRLAKSNVLTRRNRTIETLGSASVLCTDKTGTLTENKMAVRSILDSKGKELEPNDKLFVDIINAGVLASQPKPFDPMEEAFIEAAQSSKTDLNTLYGQDPIVKEYPLETTSLSVVHVWKGDKNMRVAVKGAPEAVFELCKTDAAIKKKLEAEIARMARDGLRVLAVGQGEWPASKDLPEAREDLQYELMGLVALADPVRAAVPDAVALCRQAGIRVIMITGDYIETAKNIGRSIGMDAESALTGEQFRAMQPAEQAEAVRNVSIFSRVLPEDKLTIVQALKADGHVVAMTGDGVNDSPALKASNIGIAMGKRGTDVAREASSLVLLDDNFASIVNGVRLGRRIFTNLQKAISYLLIVHMPIIIMSMVPVFMGWPLILLPIHIVFLEFIIDPSCTLIFEAEDEEPDAMQKPPRKLDSPMFNKEMLLRSLTTGLTVSAIIAVVCGVMINFGWTEEKVRSLTYLMIVLSNLFLILTISGRRAVKQAYFSFKLNPMLVLTFAFWILSIAIYHLPFLRDLFKFAPISFYEAAVITALSAVAAGMTIPIKRLIHKD